MYSKVYKLVIVTCTVQENEKNHNLLEDIMHDSYSIGNGLLYY